MPIFNRIYRSLAFAPLTLFLVACASQPEKIVTPVEIVQPVCEPEVVIEERTVLINRLSEQSAANLEGAARSSASGNYATAREKYEAILAAADGQHADAFALWGLINLFLDRDNPDYSREDAENAYDVLVSRVASANSGEPVEELRLIQAAVKALIVADASKDQVVIENASLRRELSNREEAISRLRELTVGQQ